MGKMQKKLKQATLLLAMILLFAVAFALPSFAQDADGITPGNATDGNITDGNITDGNVTDGDVTDGDVTEPVVLQTMGDLNADGTVDAGEARTVLRVSVSLDKIDPAVAAYADMDHNGVLDSGDARAILRVSVSLDAQTQHSFVNGEITAATCTADGSVAYTCAHCEQAGTISIAKLAHDFESVNMTEATCTTDGLDEQACSACGEEKEVVLKAKGHTYEEISRKEPTCTVAGSAVSECSVCGNTKTTALTANGHAYKITKDQAATCTTAGVKQYTCSTCNDVFTQNIAALGHQMVRCTATTPQHCSRCNEKYTGVQQATTGLYYYFEKNGNNYTPVKNKIIGSSYYGPDGARVDGDKAIDAAVNFVNTYVGTSGTAKERLQRAYNIFYQYFVYDKKLNQDVTDTPDGRYLPGFCTEFFEDGGGNCYRFAAALAYVARVIGYDCGFISGQISASGGGTTEHGLTEIYYNNQILWCDAMMQTSYPSINTFWVTEASYYYGFTREYRIRMYVANGKVTWK